MGLIVAAGLVGPPAHRKAAEQGRVGIGDGNNAGTCEADTTVPSNYHGASGRGEMGESLLS